MRVVIFSTDDWANMGFILAESLKSLGVDAESFKLLKHKLYRHGPNSKVISLKEMENEALKADIIQFTHSKFSVKTPQILKKDIFMFHGGGHYRENHKEINRVANQLVKASLTQTGDLLGFGAKNERWLLPGVDLKVLKPSYVQVSDDVLTIGHFPSSPRIKGTNVINGVIDSLRSDSNYSEKFNYITSNESVPYEKNIERMKKCDVYIEQIKSGEWGITALEAAALGKIVVTNFETLPRYHKEYGYCELVVVDNEKELKEAIIKLINSSKNKIKEKKKKTRKWVSEFHSYEYLGKKLLRVYAEFLDIDIEKYLNKVVEKEVENKIVQKKVIDDLTIDVSEKNPVVIGEINNEEFISEK